VPQEWVEVNIVPSSSDQPEKLLIDLIDQLAHDTFRGRVGVWFFGWYSEPQPYHLRLRIRWQQLEQADEDRADLFAFLDTAQSDGKFARWWPGNHGREGEDYEGEADIYGQLWEPSCEDWHSGSELALAVVKLDPDHRMTQDRFAQWSRRVHLHSNRLGLNYYSESLFSLVHAQGYLDHARLGTDNPQFADFIGSIEQSIEELIQRLKEGPPSHRH